MARPRRWWEVVKDAGLKWWNDNAFRLGASVSFYTIFSLAPLLVIVIAVAGFLFGEQEVQEALITEIQELVGDRSADAVKSMLQSAREPARGTLATAFSIVTLIVFATGVFTELQDGLNVVWKAHRQEEGGFFRLVKDRFFSFMVVLGLGFLLIVSLVLDTAVAIVGSYIEDLLPAPSIVLHLMNFGVSFLLLTTLFAMIFKLLPHANIAWRDVGLGAAATTLLFEVGKLLIGLYLGKAGISSAYGAASSLMVILLWVYYSALIFYFGAELTYVYAHRYGSSQQARGHGVP